MKKTCASLLLLLSSYGYSQQDLLQWHINDGQDRIIKSHDVDPVLRKMKPAQLQGYFKTGCGIRLKQYSNGDYSLRSIVPGQGGGPFLGVCTAIGGTLITAAVAAGTVVVLLPTGPLVAIGGGVVAAKAGMAVTVYATIAATATPVP